MRSIHVLRKPCSEPTVATNVLKHGTGALNIDATRVVCEGGSPSQGRREGKVPFGNYNGWAVLSQEGYKDARAGETIGRWPANLVLQHLDGCVQDGTRVVKPHNGSGRTGNGSNGFRTDYVGGKRKGVGFTGSFVGEDGTETVAAWTCAPGCPVAALDEQSGDLSSQVTRRNPDNASRDTGMFGISRKQKNGPECLGQTGGASRFFKQVKP